MSGARGLFWALSLSLWGCEFPTILVEGSPCPCVDGFVCCEAVNVCILESSQCEQPPPAFEVGAVQPKQARALRPPIVTLTGEGLEEVATVQIGGRPCVIQMQEADALRCQAPEGPVSGAEVAIVVTASDGRVEVLPGFAYLPSPLLETTQPFTEDHQLGIGVALFDLNLDGRLDLLFSDLLDEGSNAFVNEGALTFSGVNSAINSALQGSASIIPGDFTNDGRSELLVLSFIDQVRSGELPESFLLQGSLQGGFTSQTMVDSERDASLRYGIAMDFDGDNNLDVLACRNAEVGLAASPLVVLQNNGEGLLQERADLIVSTASSAVSALDCNGIAAGDFDHDGDTDAVACGEGRLVLLEKDGGLFHDRSDWLPSIEPDARCASVEFVDFDADGDLDLSVVMSARQTEPVGVVLVENIERGGVRTFVLAESKDENINLLRCDGIGALRASASLRAGADTQLWADFDHDGDQDLFLPTPSSSCPLESLLYENMHAQGMPFFSPLPIPGHAHQTGPTGILSADLDQDGDLDVIHTAWGASGRRLLSGTLADRARGLEGARFIDVRPRTDPDGDARDSDPSDDRAAWGVSIQVDLDGPSDAPDFAPGPGKLLVGTLASENAGNPAVRFGLGARVAPVHVRVRFSDRSTVVQRVERFDRSVDVLDCGQEQCP